MQTSISKVFKDDFEKAQQYKSEQKLVGPEKFLKVMHTGSKTEGLHAKKDVTTISGEL